jgi:hypothetical protein
MIHQKLKCVLRRTPFKRDSRIRNRQFLMTISNSTIKHRAPKRTPEQMALDEADRREALRQRNAEREARRAEKEAKEAAEKEAKEAAKEAKRDAAKAKRDAERDAAKAKRDAERDAAKAKRDAELTAKASEVETLRLQRQREKTAARAAIEAAKKAKEAAVKEEATKREAVTKYFHDGGELRLFADIPEAGERRFGGVKMYPPRESLTERPPAGRSFVLPGEAVVISEKFPIGVIKRAFCCAGLFRAAGTLRREKDRLTIDEVSRIEANARTIGLLPEGAPMDDVILFNDEETVRQMIDLVEKLGERDVEYTVGKADGEFGLFDGRLVPSKGGGIGTMSRPFRNFILAESGVWRRDIDFKACYPHILRQFAKHIGEPCPVLDDYLANYAKWKQDFPGCKLKTLIAMFRPDKLPPDSDKSRPASLQREMGGIIMRLVKEQEGITSEHASSPLGSAAARLFQRVERALLDEACAAFVTAGFSITAYIYDGFVISAPASFIATRCRGSDARCEELAGDVCDSLNRLWVEDGPRCSFSHKIEIKKFEYPNTPEALDEAPKTHFDFEHPTFGRVSALGIAAGLSGIVFPSFASLLTYLGPYVPRICVMNGVFVILKNTATFVRKTGEFMVRVDEKTGRTIRPPEMLSTNVTYVRERDAPSIGSYRSATGSATSSSFSILSDIAGYSAEHYTSMLPPDHPLMTPLHFTSRMRPVGLQNEWYKILTLDEAKELLEGDGVIGILPHIRNILTQEHGDVGVKVFLEMLCRSLISSRPELAVILYGPTGGELKSKFMNWFGEFVLGVVSYLVQTGIGDCKNRFRSEIEGKSLIIYEEMQAAHTVGSDDESAFKRSVDSKTVQLENKNVDKKRIEPNIATCIGCSNFPNPINLSAGNDRRVQIFTVSTKYTSAADPNAGVEYARKICAHFADPRMGPAFAKYLLEYFMVQCPFDPMAPMNPNVLKVTTARAAALFEGLLAEDRVFYTAAVSKAICIEWFRSLRENTPFVMPSDARGVFLSVLDLFNAATNILGFKAEAMSCQRLTRFLMRKDIGTVECVRHKSDTNDRKMRWILFNEQACPTKIQSRGGKDCPSAPIEYHTNTPFKQSHWDSAIEETRTRVGGSTGGWESLARHLDIPVALHNYVPVPIER